MRKGILLALALLPTLTQAQTIRLGSWNIEHLGDPGSRRGTGTNQLQKAEDLARYIQAANVDVLALQEIKADGEAPKGFPRLLRTNSILKKTFDILNRGGAKWNHVLFPRMRPADTTQWTGVAWNEAKVKPVGRVLQVRVSHSRSRQRSNKWDKNCHAIKFSAGTGKTDFVVMSVHLKANVGRSYAQHREEEIQEFVKHLPTIKKNFRKEEDLILVGDTNIQSSKERAVSLLQRAGFVNLNSRDEDTHTGRGSQPFDRFFVPGKQKEFLKSRQKTLSDYQRQQRLSFAAFRARLSDHYIIVTELQVMADDD